MKTTKYGRTTLSAIAGLTMVVSMTASPALAAGETTSSGDVPQDANVQEHSATVPSNQVTETKVVGQFAFNQTTLTPNEMIKAFFQRAAQAMCGATVDFAEDNPLEWQISVTGDVHQEFVASVGDLAGEESVNQTMTCTCGGNTAGGRAIITADVKGIPVEYLLSRSGVAAGANTLTFVSSDGTELAMPLGYVIGRHALLSYEINDEDLSASVGGNNQLWMTKTPAYYFVRDVVEIRVSIEDEAPAVPGENDEHPNSPNAGVLAGSQE